MEAGLVYVHLYLSLGQKVKRAVGGSLHLEQGDSQEGNHENNESCILLDSSQKSNLVSASSSSLKFYDSDKGHG
jgi:hypothetical protein